MVGKEWLTLDAISAIFVGVRKVGSDGVDGGYEVRVTL